MENTVYLATIKIVYTGGVTKMAHEIGRFTEREDAINASKILTNILCDRKDMIEDIGRFGVAPSTYVEGQDKCYNNIDEFIAGNMHTQRYLKDRGQEALNNIVNQTLGAENILSR